MQFPFTSKKLRYGEGEVAINKSKKGKNWNVMVFITLVRSTKFSKNRNFHLHRSTEGVGHEKRLICTTKDTTNILYAIN